jgi:hypothetical protein
MRRENSFSHVFFVVVADFWLVWLVWEGFESQPIGNEGSYSLRGTEIWMGVDSFKSLEDPLLKIHEPLSHITRVSLELGQVEIKNVVSFILLKLSDVRNFDSLLHLNTHLLRTQFFKVFRNFLTKF